MVLIYLGILDPDYSSARPQIMGSFDVSSLLETQLSEEYRSCGVTWQYYVASDRSVLADQGRQIEGRWGYTLVDVLVAIVVPRADEEVLEDDEEMALWSIVTTAKRQSIRSISAHSKGENNERCTYLYDSSGWAVRRPFKQFQMFQQQQNTQAQSFFLCRSKSKKYSYILSYIVYVICLDYRIKENWHESKYCLFLLPSLTL